MTRPAVMPSGREVYFDEADVIVSKTDLAGRIVYANDVFLSISGYAEAEVIGQPHNMIRHPDMPRTVFSLLWERLQASQEIFAYVKNMTKSGDHYWVLAHVTPSTDPAGSIVGYHSNRRVPDREMVRQVEGIYRDLLLAERQASGARDALDRGRKLLTERVGDLGLSYDRFVFQT